MPASNPGKHRKPWYSKGIRFSCAGTGHCCSAHGEYDRVYISDEETQSIVDLLGIELAAFEERYCFFEDGDRQLDLGSGACPFLKERRCAIYAARPVQCRTWPFWKDNLARQVWKEEVAPFCRGVGRGPLLSQAEIEALIEEQQDA